MLFKFHNDKNSSGAINPKNATTSTNATTTSQSDQKKGSLAFERARLNKLGSTAPADAGAVDLFRVFFT